MNVPTLQAERARQGQNQSPGSQVRVVRLKPLRCGPFQTKRVERSLRTLSTATNAKDTMTEYSKFTLTAVIGLSLLTPVDVQAIPPRQHSVTGTVERIDPAARSIVVSLGRQETSSAFVWSDTTRFYLAGAPVGVETATVGESVRLIFRREAGQRVIRKLSITREANGCCCGGAGSKHGKNSI